MSRIVEHEMIVASAGSGKTYQLTNRFLRLMAHGVPPERMIALTFTRKAAGEFFDTILTKLAEGVEDTASAGRLAEEIGNASLDQERFLNMLVELIEKMPLLELGTLDGFFSRIVGQFPFELGLGGRFEVLEESAALLEKRSVYREVFQRDRTGGTGRQQFVTAFQLATWGREEKRFVANLDAFIEEMHSVFLTAPSGDLWGNPERIWPDGRRWPPATSDLARDAEGLRALIGDRKDLKEEQLQRWNTFLDCVQEWRPGNPFPKPMAYLFERAVANERDLAAGTATITVGRRTMELSPDECRRLHRILAAVLGSEIDKKLQTTQGVHEVLHTYEEIYNTRVRRSGKLTFADIQLLLYSGSANENAAPLLTQDIAATDRLFIDFRLDGQFDHWLLDEFQDTSFVQWCILRNLIDEVVQDPEGEKSFFYVGDVKQAIYGWRGGDARLFRQVRDYYNGAGEERIVERRLHKSWRSGPDVIRMVNDVFESETTMRSLFPESTVAEWQQAWDTHVPIRDSMPGCAVLLQSADRFSVLADLLVDMDPIARGLTCAVLVQKTATGQEITEYLRAHTTIPVRNEADVRVGRDNPVAAALLSLFKFAAHPGDNFAWEHLLMTPFREVFETASLDREEVCRAVLKDCHQRGFSETSARWLERLAGVSPLDPFSKSRMKEFVAAAREFDLRVSRNAMDFIEFMEAYTLREPDSDGSVQVMTVHKAKGLGFDVVLLPELEGARLAQRRSGPVVARNSDREAEWVLDLPPKLISEQDSVLRAEMEEAEAEACFERLCLLYVAMTRARHAMYLIMEPMKSNSTSINYPRFLMDTLARETFPPYLAGGKEVDCLYLSGTVDWWENLPDRAPVLPVPCESVPPIEGIPARIRHARRLPSDEEERSLPAQRLFSFDSWKTRGFGTRVHRIFERISWVDDKTGDLLVRWMKEAPDDQTREAVQEVMRCLKQPPIVQLMSRPADDVTLWREQRFEIVVEGEWLSGTFDRVVLEKNGEGGFSRATIVDFKTNRFHGDDETVERTASRYRKQMNAYRDVLSRLTGLPRNTILCYLVFTGIPRIFDV